MFTFTDAVTIACDAHKGQKDKGGNDYLKHPLHVAHMCKLKGYSNEVQMAAVLHDVVEDSHYTFEDLIARGIPESVLDALKLLTHVKDQDFIVKVTDLKIKEGWIETIAKTFTTHSVSTDELLFSKGEMITGLYILVDGKIGLSKESKEKFMDDDVSKKPKQNFADLCFEICDTPNSFI